MAESILVQAYWSNLPRLWLIVNLVSRVNHLDWARAFLSTCESGIGNTIRVTSSVKRQRGPTPGNPRKQKLSTDFYGWNTVWRQTRNSKKSLQRNGEYLTSILTHRAKEREIFDLNRGSLHFKKIKLLLKIVTRFISTPLIKLWY